MRCRVLIISCRPPVLHTLVECSDVIVCDHTELLGPCTSSDYPIQPPFCFRLMPSHTSEEPLRACLLWNKMRLIAVDYTRNVDGQSREAKSVCSQHLSSAEAYSFCVRHRES